MRSSVFERSAKNAACSDRVNPASFVFLAIFSTMPKLAGFSARSLVSALIHSSQIVPSAAFSWWTTHGKVYNASY